MSKIDLSLIIPAYNEEKKIKKDIQEAFKYFTRHGITGEVIVSTDGVTDNTNEIVRNLQKIYPGLKLIAKKEKIGKGAAIRSAVAAAKGKYIMYADAGYCVPFKHIKTGLQLLKIYDIALGSRAISGSKIKRQQPLYRIIGSRIFGVLVHSIIGIPADIRDTQCGFKLFRKAAAKRLFADLKTREMMFDIETILRIIKYKYKYATFPVEWSNDKDTKFNPLSGGLSCLRDLIRIKFKYRL